MLELRPQTLSENFFGPHIVASCSGLCLPLNHNITNAIILNEKASRISNPMYIHFSPWIRRLNVQNLLNKIFTQ